MTSNNLTENDEDLLHRYLDGVLTRSELESLEQLLRSNADARAQLRSLATIDAKWQQLAMDESTTLISDACSGTQDRSATTRQRRRSIPLWASLIAIAASLAIAAFGWFLPGNDSTAQIETGIARVIRVEGQATVDGGRPLSQGADLFSGEVLSMSNGLIELAFRDSGVHVIATAPLQVKLDSDKRMSLANGQVKLVVPPQGIGFVVDTEKRRFIDLGTSFVVTANSLGSEVLVLDGKISVESTDHEPASLMNEGEFAKFDQNGRTKKRTASRLSLALPEVSTAATNVNTRSLAGFAVGYSPSAELNKEHIREDLIGRQLLPLIHSGFQNTSCLQPLQKSEPISFRGIAGAYHDLPQRTGLEPYAEPGGWLSWYHGNVVPPRSGRYRFWGYADNHLMVAINGKPIFEGSRRDSSFKELGISRTDNPALPCLIAPAGFACSDWIEVTDQPLQLDILFGEVGGSITSGLLLIEREGENYEETFWGQPKWPLFLTEAPGEEETTELHRLRGHMEEKTMGSFSIAEDAIWKVQDQKHSNTSE
jgi:ferric-dicitrate binding protein FerR (iron transport regulator)